RIRPRRCEPAGPLTAMVSASGRTAATLRIRGRPRHPPQLLRFRDERQADVIVRVEVSPRGLLNHGATQLGNLRQRLQRSADIGPVAVFVAARDLAEQVAVFLALPVEVPREEAAQT